MAVKPLTNTQVKAAKAQEKEYNLAGGRSEFCVSLNC